MARTLGCGKSALRRARGQRAANSHRRSAADRREGGRNRRTDPQAPGHRACRRNRFRKKHANSKTVPCCRTRRGWSDWLHPAAPRCRAQRGAPRCHGAWRRTRRNRRLSGALRRPDRRAHPGQVHDGWHPACRDPIRSLAQRLRHHHPRRSARAQPEYRFPARLPQAPARASARSEIDRHIGHDRHEHIFQTFPQCAHRECRRARLSGRGALAAGGRTRRGVAGRSHRRRTGRNHHRRPARRCAGIPARRARDSRHPSGAVAASLQGNGNPRALRAPVCGRAGPRVQAGCWTAHRAGDERGGNLADRAAHPLRRRHRHGAGEALFAAQPARTPAYRAGFTSRRRAAQGPLRPRRPGRLRAPVWRG